LYRSPLAIMAQAILAILLASATAATFVGRRANNAVSQGRWGPRERASVAPLAIGYASLSFFARNFLISAFVGSPEQCWLCPTWAVGLGEPCTKWLVRNH